MKYISLVVLLLFSVCASAKSVSLDIKAVKLPEAVSLLYSQVFDRPFMLSPELAKDERVLSFRITPDIDERAFVIRYFKNMNITISEKGGIDYIYSFTPVVQQPAMYPYVYKPLYRTVSYLSEIVRPQFSGEFNTIRSNTEASFPESSELKPETASDFLNREGDVLVYYGENKDIKRLEKLLPLIDVAGEEVVVSGYVFEVQTSEKDGSGILLAAKILSEKFKINVGSSSASPDNLISVRLGSVDAIFSVLKTDSRFSVVSAPRLRVQSGRSASFSVGADVPVLGSVSYRNNETPVQSVEYRSSGVLFNVKPVAMGQTIDLHIQQQLSNFVKTESGVNNSPTLIKRDVTTDVSMGDGDVIVIGGLAENKDSSAGSGWSLLGSRTSENTKTDIVVLLQVSKVRRN